jgi:thiol-disulfide isomerase/thioredoxin
MKAWIKILFITVITLGIATLSVSLNWINQFAIAGMAYFVSGLMYRPKFGISRFVYLLIVLIPFVALYGGLAIAGNHVHALPIAFVPIITIAAGVASNYYYYKNQHLKKVIVIALAFCGLVLAAAYIGMPNWLEYIFSVDEKRSVATPDFCLRGDEEATLCLDEQRGIVLVLDFWSTGCGACFRKFPDMEALQQHYSNENVEVIALNLLLRRDNPDSIVALANRLPYSFRHYFTTRESADSLRKHFGIQAVPHYVVINPADEVIHNGRMTTERFTRVNNAYSIIDEALRKDAQNTAR